MPTKVPAAEVTAETISVLIADDHDAVREGLTVVLAKLGHLKVVGEADCGREAVFLFRELRPDVLVTDLQMPDLSGDEVIREILLFDPDANILVYSNYDIEEDIRRCMDAGARGYLLKDSPREMLIDAIETARWGEQYTRPSAAGKVTLSMQRERLTAREIEVLELLVLGKEYEAISLALVIPEATVRTHLTNIMGKLQAATRDDAVTTAIKRGLVDLGE